MIRAPHTAEDQAGSLNPSPFASPAAGLGTHRILETVPPHDAL